MASTSEMGHVKNVANFQDLIEFVTSYGATYNPSKEALKLNRLIVLKTSAEEAIADVMAKNTDFNRKINERLNAFSGLKVLSTRLINALQSSETNKETIEDAKAFLRKMRGRKATSNQEPIATETPAPASISVSQQSYNQLIQHFAGLTAILNAEPGYNPNETDLKIENLLAIQVNLTAKNTAVAMAYANISNSRIARNNTLYNADIGLVKTAIEVKIYIKSVFGASSPQYKQVGKIKFQNVK